MSSVKHPDIGEWFYAPSWKYSVAPASQPPQNIARPGNHRQGVLIVSIHCLG